MSDQRRGDILRAPLHIAYRIAQRLRMAYWRIARPHVFGVKMIVFKGDSVLLIRHSYQSSEIYMLPGGGVGKNEDEAAAAAREVREEAGCSVSNIRRMGYYLDRSLGAYSYITVFVAETDDEAQCDGREIIEARFFPLTALPDKLSPPSARRLAEWQSGADVGDEVRSW
jgi:ADP-ribose pyrophosphatase YjhB (NUDIX family)